MEETERTKKDYAFFRESQQSIDFLTYLACFLSLAWITMAFIIFVNSFIEGFDKISLFNASINLVFNVFIIMILFLMLTLKKKMLNDHNVKRQWRWYNRQAYATLSYVVLQICYEGYRLILRTTEGQCCEECLDTYLGSWSCNPFNDAGGVPLDSVIELCLVPLVSAIILNCSFLVQALTLALSVAILVTSGVIVSSIHSFTFILVYAVTGSVLIYEKERHMKKLFLMNQQLRSNLEENERTADEKNANEMRSMIGNVAHDLKTPLMSFLSGLEVVGNVIEDLNTSVVEEKINVQDILNHTESIRECAENMRDVNSFMTMTINRCIDYTKASKGFQLIPKLVTLDLRRTMELPIKIMGNMQNRVEIRWEEFLDDGICTHIISDQQWLQENLLCLLSNAVKYSSSDAPVEVKVGRFLYSRRTDQHVVKKKDNSWKRRILLKLRAIRAFQFSLRPKVYAENDPKSPPEGQDEENEKIDVSMTFKSSSNGKSSSTSVDKWETEKTPEYKHSVCSQVTEIRDSNTGSPAFIRQDRTSSKRRFSHAERDLESGLPIIEQNNDKSLEKVDVSNKTRKNTNHTIDPTGNLEKKNSNLSIIVREDNNLNMSSSNEHKVEQKESTLELKPPAAPPAPARDEMVEVIRFSVKDCGIGLSDEAMNNLFSPFRQAQRLAGGTGLGLFSLAKRIEALHGHYGVEQRQDGQQGSVFWFSIPYRPDNLAAAMARAAKFRKDHPSRASTHTAGLAKYSTDSAPTSRHPSKKNDISPVPSPAISPCSSVGNITQSPRRMTITPRTTHSGEVEGQEALKLLLVDDSLPILKMMQLVLRKQGHKTLVAENGMEALKKIFPDSLADYAGSVELQAGSGDYPYYDVVLMDLQMPVMDGLEATRRLREREKWMRDMDALEEAEELEEEGGAESVLPLDALETNSLVPSPGARRVKRHQLVIGVSANSDHETMEAALKVGMDDFLSKPFSVDQFVRTLKKHRDI